MVGKVGCIIFLVALLVGCLGGLGIKVDLDGIAKKKWVTSGFGFKVILGGSLCVSGPCIFHLSCLTISKVA